MHLLLPGGDNRAARVEGVVERDLVVIPDNLVERGVVEGGGEVAQQAGQALAGVQDVSVCPQNDDEPCKSAKVRVIGYQLYH